MEENNSLQWLSCERETGTQRERGWGWRGGGRQRDEERQTGGLEIGRLGDKEKGRKKRHKREIEIE